MACGRLLRCCARCASRFCAAARRAAWRAWVRDGYALPKEAYAPQCPVMVLRGGRDPYARYAGPEISGAERHTLRAAAHCPAETDADAVRDYLRGWYRMFL